MSVVWEASQAQINHLWLKLKAIITFKQPGSRCPTQAELHPGPGLFPVGLIWVMKRSRISSTHELSVHKSHECESTASRWQRYGKFTLNAFVLWPSVCLSSLLYRSRLFLNLTCKLVPQIWLIHWLKCCSRINKDVTMHLVKSGFELMSEGSTV